MVTGQHLLIKIALAGRDAYQPRGQYAYVGVLPHSYFGKHDYILCIQTCYKVLKILYHDNDYIMIIILLSIPILLLLLLYTCSI